LQHLDDAKNIVAPVSAGLAGRGSKVHFSGFAEVFGVNADGGVAARGDGGPAVEVNGGGENETLVVVGVFTNEIDATGSAEEASLLLEVTVKPVFNGPRFLELCYPGVWVQRVSPARIGERARWRKRSDTSVSNCRRQYALRGRRAVGKRAGVTVGIGDSGERECSGGTIPDLEIRWDRHPPSCETKSAEVNENTGDKQCSVKPAECVSC